MKRWIILAALVVLIAGGATVLVSSMPELTAASSKTALPVGLGTLNAPKAGPQPKAVVETPHVYEFGTLPQHVTGKHKWKVENTGQGTLELFMLESTCSCTLAKFKNGEKASVAPGETTEIELEFESRDNNGDYSKGAKIGTNDPNYPSFDLHVHGKVFPAVMTFPPDGIIGYSNISNDKHEHLMNAVIYSRDRVETKVVKFKVSNEKEIDVKQEPLSAEDCKLLEIEQGTKLTINVKDGLALGAFREEVVVTTDHPKQPEVRLVLTGQMAGPINLVPAVLRRHQIDSKVGDRGELIITVRGGRETKFEVAHAPKALKVDVIPDPARKKGRYRLVVTVPPGTPTGNIEDEIVLKTDHPKAGELSVPISLWVQDSAVQ